MLCCDSNVKKYINTMQRASKHLILGNDTVSMAALLWVVDKHDVTHHGLHPTDVSSQRNRQSVPPVQRMMSEVFLFVDYCDRWVVLSFDGSCVRVQSVRSLLRTESTPTFYRSTLAFLDVIAGYSDAFTSRTATYYDRLVALSTTVFFIRLWNRWLTTSSDLSVTANGLTPETTADFELSVAAYFTVVGVFDEYKLTGEFDPIRMVCIVLELSLIRESHATDF